MSLHRPTVRFTALPKRGEIVQRVLDRLGGRVYLEIGVQSGVCFFKVRAKKKIAVDPRFLIGWKRKLKYILRNPCNLWNTYAEMTSDDFFATHGRFLHKRPPDVVLIDGLHTYDQSLRDVVNALEYMPQRGVVLVHDCNPSNTAAAEPAT
jgi:hypothetical protein